MKQKKEENQNEQMDSVPSEQELNGAMKLIRDVCADFNGKLIQHENIQRALRAIDNGLKGK